MPPLGRRLAAPGRSTAGERPRHWASITLPRVLGRAAPTLPIRRAPPLPGLGIKVLPYIEIVNGNGKVESFSCGPSKISLLQARTHTHSGTCRARLMPASSTPGASLGALPARACSPRATASSPQPSPRTPCPPQPAETMAPLRMRRALIRRRSSKRTAHEMICTNMESFLKDA